MRNTRGVDPIVQSHFNFSVGRCLDRPMERRVGSQAKREDDVDSGYEALLALPAALKHEFSPQELDELRQRFMEVRVVVGALAIAS